MTVNAWLVGRDELPYRISPVAEGNGNGDVLVHDVARDAWYFLSAYDFGELYEWA